jgi:hypothetical protein
MGIVFSLYKRKPKERYELGKHRRVYPEGMFASQESRVKTIVLLDRAFRALSTPTHEEKATYMAERLLLSDPSYEAMWSIMGTPNYSVFKLSRFHRGSIAVISPISSTRPVRISTTTKLRFALLIMPSHGHEMMT